MGATIVRGVLKYSTQTDGQVANMMIDSLIVLAGAHDGSWLAHLTVAGGPPRVGGFLERLVGSLTSQAGFDPARPAVHQLRPGSNWYGWANSASSLMVPTFNVYGDIRLKQSNCFLDRCFDTPLVGISLGDGSLLPGTDAPYDSPVRGGARFRRPVSGGGDWQWALSHTVRWKPTGTLLGDLEVNTLSGAELMTAPELHWNLDNGNTTGNVMVDDCSSTSGAKISLQSQILQVLAGRLGTTNYHCLPQ